MKTGTEENQPGRQLALTWRGLATSLLMSAALFLSTAATANAATSNASAPSKSATIASGVPWYDDQNTLLNAHGVGMYAEQDTSGVTTYYMVGGDTTYVDPATDAAELKKPQPSYGDPFEGITCYRSTDLTHWKNMGYALDPKTQDMSVDLPKGAEWIKYLVDRPKLTKFNGTYYLFARRIWGENTAGNGVLYATASQPCGPYALKGLVPLKLGDSTKPSAEPNADLPYVVQGDIATWTENDSIYLVTEYPSSKGATGLYWALGANKDKTLYAKRQYNNRSFIDAVSLRYSESPVIFKAGATYYWLTSVGMDWYSHDNVYATATSIEGPWTYRGRFAPKGTDTWNSQSTFVLPVVASDGKKITYIYMGDRWCATCLGYSTNVWQPIEFGDVSKMKSAAQGDNNQTMITESDTATFNPGWRAPIAATFAYDSTFNDDATQPRPIAIRSFRPIWTLDLQSAAVSDVDLTLGKTITNYPSNDATTLQFRYPDDKSWVHAACDGRNNCASNASTVSYTNKKGAEATADFTGTQLNLFSVVGVNEGLMSVRVDRLAKDGSIDANVIAETWVNLRRGSSALDQGTQLVWSSPVLAQNTYRLTVKALGRIFDQSYDSDRWATDPSKLGWKDWAYITLQYAQVVGDAK